MVYAIYIRNDFLFVFFIIFYVESRMAFSGRLRGITTVCEFFNRLIFNMSHSSISQRCFSTLVEGLIAAFRILKTSRARPGGEQMVTDARKVGCFRLTCVSNHPRPPSR